MQAPSILTIHLLLAAIVIVYEVCKGEESLPGISILGYFTGLLCSIVLYRISPLYRLYHFPGPRLAAVSKLWHVW